MTRKNLSGLVAIVFVLGAAALAQGELPPLIPREVLFGNPVKAASRDPDLPLGTGREAPPVPAGCRR
jgi:hypothetical protein